MSLGYVLLHPSRVELALGTGGTNLFMHEMTDVAFGGMAVGSDLADGFTEYFESRGRLLEGLLEQLRPWISADGPLGFLAKLGEEWESPPDVAAWLDRLSESLSSLPALKESLQQWARSFADMLPDGGGASLSVYLREQFDAITQILESPLRNGRNDTAAQRGFRAAATLRHVFGPFFEKSLTAFAAVDIKAFLLRFIDDLFSQIQFPDLERFAIPFNEFRARFGGLLRAFASLNASISVSATAGEGPQGSAENPTVDELEQKAAPDRPGSPMWWLDLVTGVLASFSSIWEMVRAGNLMGGRWDGALNIIGIVWHVVQTTLRAAIPGRISFTDPADGGQRVRNWFFTDQGNMLINLVLRLVGSLNDSGAASNWAQSFLPSMLKYYTNMVNMRSTYWTVRAYRYFRRRKAAGIATPPLLTSTLWALWGPCLIFTVFMALIPAWEDYSLETGLGKARTLAPLLIALAVGPTAGYLLLWQASGAHPIFAVEPNWMMFALIAAVFVLGVIALGIILGDTDSEKIDTAIGLFIAVAILLCLALIGIAIIFGLRHTGGWNRWVLFGVILVLTLLMAVILPFFLWWYYIDEGRDKHHVFEGMNADTSPYKLPYPRGRKLMCSQGVHGLFSHYLKAPEDFDNHYSYDFNDSPGEPALAARAGIVVQYNDDIPTSKPGREGAAEDDFEANSIKVQHIDWVERHDPGAADEKVLTLASYVHQPQHSAFVDVGQRIEQGYHLGDIDSTGRSAVHHLHFNVAERQTEEQHSLPAIFRDSDIRRFRHFPLVVSWWPGGWHVDGKPFSHAFFQSETDEAQAVRNPIRVRTAPAGAVSHSHTHFIELDRRSLGTGSLAASVTLLTSGTEPSSETDAVAAHFHSVTLSEADIRALWRMGTPGALTTADFRGHSHGFGSIVRWNAPAYRPLIAVADAPPARLTARQASPYNLVGDQLVLRVNGRHTDFLLYGCHRPTLLADVALDRGIRAGSALSIAGQTYPLSGAAVDRTVRGNAMEWNRILAVGVSGGPGGLAITMRCLPAIVIETRRRGRTAALLAIFRSANLAAAGTGFFDDLSQVPLADLANHVGTILQNGWPAPPAGLNTSINSDGELAISATGLSIDFSPSSSRISQVLTGLWRSGAIRARGAMPLATGRVAIGGPAPWPAPLLATAAEVRIETNTSPFQGANLATPLIVDGMGRTQQVILDSADPAAIARRICANVEGVRAWSSGPAEVTVQTIAGGSDASLELRKPGVLGFNHGASAPLTGSAPALSDTTAVLPATLEAVLDDAAARATLPYNPASVNPQSPHESGKLVIQVGTGTISATASFTGRQLFAFTNTSPQRLEADAPATLSFTGPAWIDATIDSATVRIPIDGEAARVDLPVFEGMPAAGETLQLTVNGSALPPLAFSGSEANIEAVAAAIAQHSPDIVVRVAYALSIENTYYQWPGHTLVLAPSTGLAAAGFLRGSNLQADFVGHTGDPLEAGKAEPKKSERGVPVAAFDISETGTANQAWRLQGTGGLQVIATHTSVQFGPDPLGLPTAAASFIDTALVPGPIDMRARCHEYEFRFQNTNGATIARTWMQISATPAAVRSRTAPGPLPLDVPSTVLNVAVVSPGPVERSCAVDLAGLGSLGEIAQKLNDATADIRAWAILTNPARLHIETAGAGTAWGLRLDNPPLLVALGFDPRDIDMAAGTLTASGRGTVTNSTAVTREEILAALNRARDSATGATAVRQFEVADEWPDIALRSLAGMVTVETEPSSLRSALNVAEAATRTAIQPGTLNTDNASIILKVGGNTAAVVHLWGDYATVRGKRSVTGLAPADLASLLDGLKASQLTIVADGVTRTLPVLPAAASTVEDAIEFLGGQAPEAWIGIVDGVVVVQSREAGASSSVSVDFSAFPAADVYPLGFEKGQLDDTFVIAAAGRGTVDRLRAITQWKLFNLLRAAADRAASPQTVYAAALDASTTPATVRLTANVFNWSLEQTVTDVGPNKIVFGPPGTPEPEAGSDQAQAAPGPGNVLEKRLPPAQGVDPGEFELQVVTTHPQRVASALFAGQPARLPGLQMPAAPTALHDKTLNLSVGGTVFPVRLRADASTTEAMLAAQIERQTGWRVRARVQLGSLYIETVARGWAAAATLAAAPAGVDGAITGNVTTGLTAPAALPIAVTGAGMIGDMSAVTPEEIRSALERAHISLAGDEAAYGTRSIDSRSYDAVGAAADFATIRSNREGCISSLETVVDLSPSLVFERSFERAPATRASIALPAFRDPKALSGTLHIQFNDNGGAAGIAAAVVVPVTFAAGSYSPKDVARIINEEVFRQGAGQAGDYPDGVVVIETLQPGLAGTVRVPAPGTAASGPDRDLLQALTGGTAELFQRGWPGIGFGAVRQGMRSARGNARAAATWVFTVGKDAAARSTAPITIAAGQSLAAIQSAVDSALGAVAGGRIGMCALGADDTLYIESGPQPMTLGINGSPWAVLPPHKPGDTPDFADEPALGLRRTHFLRTVRYARDSVGNRVDADFQDAGWVRMAARRDTAEQVEGIWFPGGIYRTAGRADAAKTTGYDATGDMIVSAGVHPGDGSRLFAHRARYWMSPGDGKVIRVVRLSSGELLLDVVW